MPGRTIYLEDNPNDFEWEIPSGHGHQFEKLIEICLKRHVATLDGKVSVTRTRATGDMGRDFEIRFSDSLQLFGMLICARKASTQDTIFVECKSTENERLDDGFLADASQHSSREACAYVLITNAVITPYCLYRAQQEWARLGMVFYLIDRRKLAEILHVYEMKEDAARLRIPIPAREKLPAFSLERLVVACQTEYLPRTNSRSVQVFVSIANYSRVSILSNLHLATDLQWTAQQQSYERFIEPGMIENIQLTADRQDWGGPAEIGLNLSVNGRSQRLFVTRTKTEIAFAPPFHGAQHLGLRDELRRLLEMATGFRVICVQGEAGVGKSRTIHEAVEPLSQGRYSPFVFYFLPRNVSGLSDYYETFGISENPKAASNAMRISALLGSAAKNGEPVILRFEDLHHADEEVITIFKQAIVSALPAEVPLVLILTGRDDHTFPNEAFYSLLQLFETVRAPHARSYTLSPLTDKDAHTLIRDIVQDIPEIGVERVHKLGQNNPFIIMEVLQYLLDAKLARLLSRRTIGILNPEVFSGRQGLPATVEELYQLRFASLQNVPGGALAGNFLLVASYFGFPISDDVRRAFFDGENDGDLAWDLLRERRFIREDPDSGEAAFAHENLLHYVRSYVRQQEHALKSSELLLQRPGLCKRLPSLDLGELYYLHQDYDAAFRCFAPVCRHIDTITNFSSEEIPRSYFAYLPAIYRTGLKLGSSAKFLAKLALAYGYMGVHNFPLVVADDACFMAKKFLEELYPDQEDGLREKLAIDQLRAHALQNMGRTGLALQQMLEIDAKMRKRGGDWPDVAFDLYDRLEEYYRKINHWALVEFYDRQASACVKKTNDEKLLAAHLITHSLICLYSGQEKAQKRAKKAHEAAKQAKIRRFITHTRLTEIIVEVLYGSRDPKRLGEIAAEARALLQEAVMESFSDSIMRLELLLGTLALHSQDDVDERHARARSYVASGQANSVRYGNGLFDWAFDNLAAVIDVHDRHRNDEDARQRFRTCLERLRHRGLTFLGAEDGTYPNAFAISNIVRFFGSLQESEGVWLVQGSLAAYDNRFVADEWIASELVRKAVKGQAIFWPKSRLVMLRYPAGDGYFTPIF